jgi:hypothetical protein
VNSLRRELWFLALILVLGIAVRVAVIPVYSGTYNHVDVYTVSAQASKLILNMQNPYTFTYTIHNSTLGIFNYLPMVPIYYAPFYLLGDIMYGNIFADVLIMLSLYWIAKSLNFKTAVYAPLTFAILPWSIWLTSIASTNFMVGTAFLMLSIAALMRKKYIVAAGLLGLAVASNQVIITALPLFGYYYWRVKKLSRFTFSLAVLAAIILLFFLSSPSQFFNGVVTNQFARGHNAEAIYGLNGILSALFNIQLSILTRVAIFSISYMFVTYLFRKKSSLFLLSAGLLMFFAAFVLPVDTMWNYYLPTLAFFSIIATVVGDEVDKRACQVKWWPRIFDEDWTLQQNSASKK